MSTDAISYEEALLHQTHLGISDLREVHERLIAAMLASQEPAVLETLTLSSAAPITRSQQLRDAPTRSVGVINPTGFALRLGLSGGSGTPAARGVPVPPGAAITLPVAVAELEIGLDDPVAVGALTVVFYVLRFRAVQPFHINRYG